MHNEIQLRRPSVWYSLLWKDFQQVKSSLLAVLVGLLSVQLVFLAIALSSSDYRLRNGLLEGLAFVPCLAPILLAVGCSGMLIGQERQSGTWGWASSLPVSWRRALVSKLCITLFATATVALLLCIAPLVLVLMRMLVIENLWQVVGYTTLITFIIMVEVVVYFYLASLLIRETLTALVCAVLAITVGQLLILFLSLLLGLSPSFLERTGLRRESAVWLANWGWTTGVIVAGSVAMVWAYRSRWKRDEMGLRWFSKAAASAELPRASNFSYSSNAAPSQWQMLVRQALNSSWPMRLVVFLLPLLFAWTGGGALNVIVPVVIGFMGLSAFEGDQSQQRIRFLADRGVDPMKLITSRLLVTGLWSVGTIVVLLALVALDPHPEMRPSGEVYIGNLLGAAACTFLLGALAAMCFKKPVIAATVALVTAITAIWIGLALITVLLADQYGRLEYVQPYLERSFGYFWIAAIPTALVLVVAIFSLAKHWVVRQEDRLPLHYAWICFLAWAIPVLSVAGAIVLKLFPEQLSSIVL